MDTSSLLADLHCTDYGPDARRLDASEIAELQPQVAEWRVHAVDGIARLERVFLFPDFLQALAFTNAVARLAEAEGHHPALLLEWGRVTVQWWTHFLGGLHHNDFIAAAKTDRLAAAQG